MIIKELVQDRHHLRRHLNLLRLLLLGLADAATLHLLLRMAEVKGIQRTHDGEQEGAPALLRVVGQLRHVDGIVLHLLAHALHGDEALVSHLHRLDLIQGQRLLLAAEQLAQEFQAALLLRRQVQLRYKGENE